MNIEEQQDTSQAGLKTGYQGSSSQNLGLSCSSSADGAPEERGRGRRVGVLESDSDYVKLAKRGGQKGLLWHEESQVSEPVQYTPSNWFGSEPADNNGNLSTEDVKRNVSTLRHAAPPPFGTDADDLQTEKGDTAVEAKEDVNNKQENQEPISPTQDQNMSSTFKKLSLDKKPAPVSMSKLLSFGYVEQETVAPGGK
ncbi:hypothetical protein NHX12_007721 [Muraenolepis orangiensis]|uniref:Uncharacterized protein n=1 Tax=Muraenolepis orangiensis TaxID=630683 RepID=A0A9Q0DNE5_9TELE|nr:hypothetical protein NHX12_007721 [Muraenolepis orangiensis]